MGIIKHVLDTGKKSLFGFAEDQFLNIIEPASINSRTLASFGVSNKNKGKYSTGEIVQNGSIINVPENTTMLLVDGGKIVAITNEAGYYKVEESSSNSFFYDKKNYENMSEEEFDKDEKSSILNDSVQEMFNRFKYDGNNPNNQKVVYINQQEIAGFKFGTKTPVSYSDRVLISGEVVPCKLTSFGEYSIKITNPILFYNEVMSKTSKESLTISDVSTQYLSEFLSAYSSALAKLSQDMILVSDIQIHQKDLSKYMSNSLDEDWGIRGIDIVSVGISSISFDETTNELLEQYAKDSLLMSDKRKQARMTAGMAKGMENIGNNPIGTIIGINAINGVSNGMGINNAIQNTAQPTQSVWNCKCGTQNQENAKFCGECGNKKDWTCDCGMVNTTKFCGNCGKPQI